MTFDEFKPRADAYFSIATPEQVKAKFEKRGYEFVKTNQLLLPERALSQQEKKTRLFAKVLPTIVIGRFILKELCGRSPNMEELEFLAKLMKE